MKLRQLTAVLFGAAMASLAMAEDQLKPSVQATAGVPLAIVLQPFEILTLEATPAQ